FSPVAGAAEKIILSSETTVVFANYGVTNDLDIGLAVPWVRVSVASEVFLLSSSGIDLTAGHPITLPRATATGIGDIAILGKYRLWHNARDGFSASVATRLPSGDPNQLRGTGVGRTLVSAVWSRSGTVAPHTNVGYEFWSKAVPISPRNDVNAKDRLQYAGG